MAEYGVLFSSHDIGWGPEEFDTWIGAAVDAGFGHLVFTDHSLGVDAEQMPEGWDDQWPGKPMGMAAYTYRNIFRDPFVMMAYAAARCDLGLATGVLVLPQRQTALVAKQAADVDLLSNGRVQLAVGIGWNPVEYEGMGADFRRRGRMLDEQIEVLRRLWTEDVVSYQTEMHSLRASGIQARPKRSIPIWIGGHAPKALDRVGRVGDGWFFNGAFEPESFSAGVLRIKEAAARAGRDPESIGFEAQVAINGSPGRNLADVAAEWEERGATRITFTTRTPGRSGSLEAHCETILAAGAALGLPGTRRDSQSGLRVPR